MNVDINNPEADIIKTSQTPGTPGTPESPCVQYGWICPRCGAVMSPWQSYCINCSHITMHVGDICKYGS